MSHATLAKLTITNSVNGDYGSVDVNTAHTQIFTVLNSGTTAAVLGTISSTALNLPLAYQLVGGTCVSGMALSAGGICQIIIQYQPHSVAFFNGNLTLAYESGTTRAVVAMPIAGAVNPLVDFRG